MNKESGRTGQRVLGCPGSLVTVRYKHAAALQPDGKALVNSGMVATPRYFVRAKEYFKPRSSAEKILKFN